MIRRALLVLLVMALAFVPGAAAAQGPSSDDEDDFLLRINGNVRIAPDEQVQSVVVISADVVVDGTVRDTLVVIDGTAVINGTVTGDVTVVKGDLELRPSATVKNVTLYRSTLTRDAGATVTGTVSERAGFSFSWGIWWLFWLGLTVAVVVGGLLFAAVGGRQLSGAAGLIGSRPGETILTALIVWIGLPVLAVFAIVTVVGIPLGLSILLFLLPALWFIGYLVIGAELGTVLARVLNTTVDADHPYVAVVLGLVVLQAVGFVPFFGGFVVMLAGLLGGGALVYRLWHGWRGTAAPRPVAAPAT